MCNNCNKLKELKSDLVKLKECYSSLSLEEKEYRLNRLKEKVSTAILNQNFNNSKERNEYNKSITALFQYFSLN